MPKHESSLRFHTLSGRWHLTCRTALFLALALVMALLPLKTLAQDPGSRPPGSFVNSTQKSDSPPIIQNQSNQNQSNQYQSNQSQSSPNQPNQSPGENGQ